MLSCEFSSSLRALPVKYILYDNSAITRELPDHYPFVVSNEYIKAVIEEWDAPARTLFDQVQHILMTHVKQIVATHFSKFAHGNLQHHVT